MLGDSLRWLVVIRAWLPKLSIAIADQGLTSGANFISTILLARFLDASEYGCYVLAMSVIMFISGVQNGIVLEPIAPLRVRTFQESSATYFSALIMCNFVLFSLPSSAAMIALGVFFGANDSIVLSSFIAGAVFMPFYLMLLLIRRWCYVETRSNLAIRGSIITIIIFPSTVFVLHYAQLLTPSLAYVGSTTATVAAIAVVLPSLLSRIGSTTRSSLARMLSAVTRSHWQYGKWALAAMIVGWVASGAYAPIIGGLLGREAVGHYQATANLLLPAQQGLTVLAYMFVPWMAKGEVKHGVAWLVSSAQAVTTLTVVATVGFVAGICVHGRALLDIVYGADRYDGSSRLLLPALGATLVMRSLGDVLANALRALGLFRPLFVASLTASTTAAIALPLLTWTNGLVGAAIGNFLAAAVSSAVIVRRFLQLKRGAKQPSTLAGDESLKC